LSNPLDAVFASYETRKQSETEIALQGSAKAKAEVALGLATLRSIVLPVLRAIESQITAHSHKAKITEKLDDAYPALILEFTPCQRTPGPPFHVPSRIAFTYYGGAIETLPEIAVSGKLESSCVALEDVTAEWVTEQVSVMAAAALERV
jgi:hypothetical protein